MKSRIRLAFGIVLLAGSLCAYAYDAAKITLNEPGKAPRTFTEDVQPVVTTQPAAPTIPAAPDAVATSDATQSAIMITWRDNSDDETGFDLQHSNDNVTFEDLPDVGADVHSFFLTGLQSDTLKYFRVRAYNAAGASDWTQPVAGRTLPPIIIPETGSVEGGTGHPTTVADGAKIIDPGADIAKLTGVNALHKGNYSCSGKLADGVKIFCADGIHTAVVQIAKDKQITGGAGVEIYGVVFQGGGTGTHNDQASIITNNKWYLEDVQVERSTGTGISINGTGVKSVRLIAQDNAASGRGFKCKGSTPGVGYLESDAIIRRNNAIAKDGDGADKATRSSGILIVNCWCYENTGRGLWFDFSNTNNEVRGGCFHDNRTKTTSDYSFGGGIFFEYNAGAGGAGGLVVDGVTFYGNDGISMSVGESQNVEIKNCVFKLGNPKSNYSKWAIGFRNIKRGTETNLIRNINIHDNTFDDGTGIYSNGGVSLSGNRITIGVNHWSNGVNVNLN